MRKQHASVEPIEHSERPGTKARSEESRRAAKQVSTTKPYVINHDSGATAEDRRHQSHVANGHQASEGIGLDAASKSNVKPTRGGNTSIEPVDKAVPFGRDRNSNQ
jgi:hypothetical protein